MTPGSHGVTHEIFNLGGAIAVGGVDRRYGPDIYIHALADALAHGSS